MKERKFLAISIKHTIYGWKFGKPCVLWGWHQTTDDEKRCFANYTQYPEKAEVYSFQLREHKLLPKEEQYARTEWWLSAKKALTIKQKELAELKALRKMYDQQIKAYEFQVFKDLVKVYVGEIKYKELLQQMESELEAYKLSDMMRHEYTRSNSKSSVTNISKL